MSQGAHIRSKVLGTRTRIALVPVLVVACFWLYGNAMVSVQDALFPYVKMIPAGLPLLRRFAVANLTVPVSLVGAALLAYPVARIYGKQSTLVALLIVLPNFALQLHGSMTTPRSVASNLAIWWEFLAFALSLLGAVVMVRRHLERASQP